MMDRYVKKFSLEKNLYEEKSPVQIVAGALLQDNSIGKLLIQLKLQNISYKEIKEVHIGFRQKDAVGESIGDQKVFSYLDLKVKRDTNFGEQTPIYLSEINVCSFSVWVMKVVYADSTQIELDGNEEKWQSLPNQTLLEKEIPSENLRRQYLREAQAKGEFCLEEERDLWLCTCGAVNRAEETKCHDCGGILERLQQIDIAGLEVRFQQYTEEKKREDAVVRKRKQKKLFVIIGAVLMAVAIVLGVSYVREKPYLDAKKLLNSGDSYAAHMAFDALGDFKDSEKMADEAEMQNYIDQALVGEYSGDIFAYWRSKTENSSGYIYENYYKETYVHSVLVGKDWYEVCVGDTFGRKLYFNKTGNVVGVGIKDFITLEADNGAKDSFGYEFDSAGKESKGICRISYDNEKTGYWLSHIEDDLIVLRGHGGETVLLLRDQGKWFKRWEKCIEFYELR